MRDSLEAFVNALSPQERAVFPWMYDLWLRPEQRLPTHDWSTCVFLGGRGAGKTFGIAVHMIEGIRSGRIKKPVLVGPNEKRVDEVQITQLIELAPPWFRPERHKGGLLWPNGVFTVVFTAEVPDNMRGQTADFTWCTELVYWPHTTREETWNQAITITRLPGGLCQVVADTTSKGKNPLILKLVADSEADPHAHVIIRSTMFDNPLYDAKYVRALCRKLVVGSRRYNEEILGHVYAEASGALWRQEWIDAHRIHMRPLDPELILVGVDPALATGKDNDETGIVVAARDRQRHVCLLADYTGKLKPDEWGDIVVSQCIDHGAAGVVCETNHIGHDAEYIVRSRAQNRNWQVHMLETEQRFPRRDPGRIFMRRVFAAASKTSRAEGPATETEAGRVHIVGTLPELEYEFTTFEPGGKSPNRYDAAVYVIIELAELAFERKGNAPEIDVENAAEAMRELNARLTQHVRMQRVGL